LNPKTMSWKNRKTHGNIPSPRSQHSAAIYGNRMFVVGGTNSDRILNDVYFLDLETMFWTKVEVKGTLPPTSFVSKKNFTIYPASGNCGLIGTRIFLLTESANMEMYIYDIESSTWTKPEIDDSNMPYGRSFHTCCVYKSSLIVYGGSLKNRDEQQNEIYWCNVRKNFPLATTSGTSSSFSSEIAILFNSEKFSDIKFVFESGEVIPAHRYILYVRCPFFRAMLDSGMTEAKMDRITITEYSFDIFLQFLCFLYTDNCTITLENAEELLSLANLYQVNKLERICEAELAKQLNENNVCSLFEIADDHHYSLLQLACLDFILTNIDSIEGFKKLRPQLQKEVTKRLSRT